MKTATGTQEVKSDYLVLATGSYPTKIPGLSIDSPRVLDSTGALDLPAIPKTLLVVGGGYIGLELGSVYAALGTKVSVVEMTPGLLPGADRDLVKPLAQRIEKTFAKVMLSTKVTGMVAAKSGIAVTFEGEGAPASETYDYVLVSIGRRPNSKVPGLETTKVKVDAKGFIETDGQRRTAEPTVFAIGDVAGEPMLAHKASHEARVAIDAIAGHKVDVRAGGDSGGGLHRSRDRLGRPDRSRGREGRPQGRGRALPVGGLGPGHRHRPRRRADQAGHRPRHRADPRRRHGRLGRRRAHRRGRAGDRDGRHGHRREADHPPAPDPVGDGDGGRRGVLRAGHARLPAEEEGCAAHRAASAVLAEPGIEIISSGPACRTPPASSPGARAGRGSRRGPATARPTR